MVQLDEWAEEKEDKEGKMFNMVRITKYFFTKVLSMVVCLIRHESVTVFKEYSISRHSATQHVIYSKRSMHRWLLLSG